MKTKRTRRQEYIPKWGYWTIGVFILILILLCMAVLENRKPSKNSLPIQADESPHQASSQKPSTMPNLTIIEHTTKLPHKQSFRIILPKLISESDLTSLTKDLVAEHRVGAELMFFNWWLSNQNVQTDDCWARAKVDGDSVTLQFNADSLEQRLDAVEIRPLSVPDELGLWYWNRGDLSQYIHLVKSGSNEVKVHSVFLDGSNSTHVKNLESSKPLVFLWSDEDDEDKVYFEANPARAVIRDEQGIITTLEKLR